MNDDEVDPKDLPLEQLLEDLVESAKDFERSKIALVMNVTHTTWGKSNEEINALNASWIKGIVGVILTNYTKISGEENNGCL